MVNITEEFDSILNTFFDSDAYQLVSIGARTSHHQIELFQFRDRSNHVLYSFVLF